MVCHTDHERSKTKRSEDGIVFGKKLGSWLVVVKEKVREALPAIDAVQNEDSECDRDRIRPAG